MTTAEQKRLIKRVEKERGGMSFKSWQEAKDEIDADILPLVKAMDTSITVPIFSCACKIPYVNFLLMPRKKKIFSALCKKLIQRCSDAGIIVWVQKRELYTPKQQYFSDWRIRIINPAIQKADKIKKVATLFTCLAIELELL